MSRKEREWPDLDHLPTLGLIIYFASSFIGEPVIGIFNRVNPWIIVDAPFLVSVLIMTAFTIWIRRTFFNLVF